MSDEVTAAEIWAPCFACGRMLAVTHDAQGPNGFLHEPLHEILGPNGETGCAAFDALDGSTDAMVDYARKCREAFEQEGQN